MARHAKKLSQGNDATQHLSLGALALCFPLAKIQDIIDRCDKGSRRVRDLPAAVVAVYVIALNLFPGVAYESVLRWMLAGLQWLRQKDFRVSTKGALSQARQALGALPMRCIHEEMALPLADPKLPGSFWKGFHLVAFDGSTLALQDTKSNSETFGRSSNQNGEGAWPMARFVALVEVGTHLIFAAALGGYRDSEITLAKKILPRLSAGMLCLADRLFPGYGLWKEASATGAQLLWRAKIGMKLKLIKRLSDGSYLAHWKPSGGPACTKKEITVRVIEYKLREPGQTASEAIYRLITTILDPTVATAEELVAIYPQRWEIEITIKESKTIYRKGQVTLRSKVAELVHQEFWGLLLAHYLVRKMMAQAAQSQGIDPDKLSYQGSIEIIKATLAGPVLHFPPPHQK